MNAAYKLARKEIGTWEWKDGHNPVVLQYFEDTGHAWVQDDETAWCAAFVGSMLKRAGFKHTGKLNARSYQNWGEPVERENARPGDIVVFTRGDPNGWQGHVAFFVKDNGSSITVLGGNQSNQVNEARYASSKLLAIRRPQESSRNTERKSRAQSTTLQAVAVTGASGAGAVFTALSSLDPAAQYIVLGCAAAGLIGLGWIARERLRKWAEGER